MIERACRIACPADMAVPVIRREFAASKPLGGRIEITGLGWFALYINGARVGEDVFAPAFTDYEYRDRGRWKYPIHDVGRHRVQYMEYDVGAYLRDGGNTLEIRLGPGFYRQHERMCEGEMSFGERLNALYALEIRESGGTVVLYSDGSERCAASEVIASNIFLGETHDANLLGREIWRNVERMPFPDSALVKQTCPPDRVIRVIRPRMIGGKDGKRLYDIGVNTTFRIRLTATGKPGDRVIARVSEEIKADFEPDFASTGSGYRVTSGGGQIQGDTFILSGKTHVFVTEFVWHAGRYIELSGECDDLLVEVVHTAVREKSTFRCADRVLNWLYGAYVNSQLTNLHGCIPSDCPHRERLGYTGDGQICVRAALYTLDMKEAYRKWIYDILDCQDLISGHVQHTAPHMGGGGGPGGWGCAIVIVPDEYDRFYDDPQLLRTCWPHMRAWISYLCSHSENGLVVREEPRGWCLGDWSGLHPMRIPIPYVNTCFLLDCLNRMVRIGERLGYAREARAYAIYAERVKKALIEAFYDPATGSFCGEVNGADAFALYCGIAPDERTGRNLAARYTRRLDHFDTGFLGTEILIHALCETGNADAAYDLLSADRMGSYGYMMNSGATTLWENFDGSQSHNHPMFGAPVVHLFDAFLGIRYERGALMIAPRIPGRLEYASGSVELPIGLVSVSWARQEDQIRFELILPASADFVYGQTRMHLDKGVHCLNI